MMNDIEFAGSISPRIGALYAEAKGCHTEFPEHALNRLRGVCHLVCDLLSESGGVPVPATGDLERKIYLLFSNDLIDDETRERLTQLRRNGNKGAHPEKFFLAQSDFEDLAAQSLVTTRILLEELHHRLHPDAPLPTYSVADSDTGLLENTCYQAMIGADPEARYVVGKYLLGKADEVHNAVEKEAKEHGSALVPFEYQSFRDQAYFWFKLASDQDHAPSMFEYGVALAGALEGDDRKALGESTVWRAAAQGNANAHAFVGNCLLEGSVICEKDPVEARVHLEQAAAADHPGALAQLGALYAKGIGGPANPKAAFDYSLRAAEAGYPVGQYNLYVLLLNGEGVDRDEAAATEWLRKAADQGFPEAMLALGRQASQGAIPGMGFFDAEALFERCIPSLPEAAYDLALLCQSRGDFKSLQKAAGLLQHCYEREGGETDLARRCWKEAPKLVRVLKDGLSSQRDDNDVMDTLLTLNLFDDDGHPHKNRKERMSAFAKQVISFRDAIDPAQREQVIEKLMPKGVRRPPPKVVPIRTAEKVGRNDPCPCGSGKKYKVCCGR